MFNRIVIELDGPICSCEEMSLSWTVGREILTNPDGTMRDGAYLQVSCKTCATKLHVPNGKFVAAFQLKKGYPKKAEPMPEPPPKPKLELLAGGKVIPFINSEEEKQQP